MTEKEQSGRRKIGIWVLIVIGVAVGLQLQTSLSVLQPTFTAEGPEGSEGFMRAMVVSAAFSCVKLASCCTAFWLF